MKCILWINFISIKIDEMIGFIVFILKLMNKFLMKCGIYLLIYLMF